MNWCSQRGEGRASFLITLALFCMGGWVLFKYVPARINAYQFREALREEARYAAVHGNDESVTERLLNHAEALNIPLDPKKLTIRRTKTQVEVTARYVQPIDLKFATYNFKFDSTQTAPLF